MIERERRRIHEPTLSDQATNGSGEINADSPLVDRLHELERRVSAACDASSDKTSSQLAELADDLQHGIIAAEQHAASERDAAYDPARSPDLHAANERMTNAQLLHGRLATQQPRLLRRCQQVQQAEEVAAYLAKRDSLRTEHDALQSELAEVYADAASKNHRRVQPGEDVPATAHDGIRPAARRR